MSDLREALKTVQDAIEQAIDCVRGETLEDCTDEEAREDTLTKLRNADEIVAALAQPEAVGPVAWQWRYVGETNWKTPLGGRHPPAQPEHLRQIERRPLFATPPLAPDERMRRALEKIAGSHWERVGYCQSDVDDVPDLTAEEAMREAREALSRADEGKESEGGERDDLIEIGPFPGEMKNPVSSDPTPQDATAQREAIARIIEPTVFWVTDDPVTMNVRRRLQKRALAKADAILALQPRAGG